MGSLYLSENEIAAIKAINDQDIEGCIKDAIDFGQVSALYDLRLAISGSHLETYLHRLEGDLANHGKAKAAAKRRETWSRAWSSGQDLIHAVRDMKRMAADQEVETQLLKIDDHIQPPRRFGERIEVRVPYQWRPSVDAAWAFGTITFSHTVDMRPDYSLPQPTRKLSAAKADQQRQEDLYGHWEHLHRLALHAVREFLKEGGDGSTIPETYEAKPARNDRHLNNFSCDFWGGPGVIQGLSRSGLKALEQRNHPSAQRISESDRTTTDGRLSLNGRVRHSKFGSGIIVRIDGERVVAEFAEVGSKTVLGSFLEPATNGNSDFV